MKKNILNKSFALILTLILTLAFTAALAEPTKVIIATEGAYAPYNYVNEDGSPDGYDIAVAKAVDDLLEDYEFEYIPVEWSSIFAGLEADRYQVIVSQAAKTPEREEKYLFGDVAYSWTAGAIAFQKGVEGITGLGSIAGTDLKLSVAVGSSNENIALTWNAEHPDAQLNIVYNDGDISKALLDVQEGRVDATLAEPPVAANVISVQGLNVDYVLYSKLLGIRDKKITRYVFRNAMLPQVTGLALSLGTMVGGALITETIFSYPGIGLSLMKAVRNIDYTLISGCTLIISITVLIANFLVDLLIGVLDPRVRAAQTEEG